MCGSRLAHNAHRTGGPQAVALVSAVYVYSLPALELLGSVDVGRAPDWVTLTPDGRTAYVANAGSNSVSVVDLVGLKEVTRIPVGQVPKRNITVLLP
jgi:YVTN family beta-propeller protein